MTLNLQKSTAHQTEHAAQWFSVLRHTDDFGDTWAISMHID